MKHIFTVFSHITFYVAHSIIKTENLNIEDCVLLTGRKYKIPSQYNDVYKKIVDLSNNKYLKPGRLFRGINIIKTILNRQDFDRMIDAFVYDDDYCAYIAGKTDEMMNLLVSKVNCSSYYIFEEGTGDYVEYNERTFNGIKYLIYKVFLKNLFPRYYPLKEKHIDLYYKKFQGFYGSEKAFSLFSQYPKKTLNIQFDTINLGYKPEAVFSVDPLFLYTDIGKVKKIYIRLAHYFANKNYMTIVYKYHPFFAVNPEIKQVYSDLISEIFGNNWIELKDTDVMENILYTYKCDFYSAGSSVQVYGALVGAHCYVFTNLLHQYVAAYDNTRFKDFVEEIEFEEEY